MKIEAIKLLSGTHADTATTGHGCFMNVISYLNGEAQITDKSTCVCPTIRLIAIWLNDFADDELRQRMVPFILRAFGSATDNKVEMERRLKAVVKYAEFNARLAAYFAKSAGYAGYAAQYAKSAGYAAMKEASFQAGLDFLDEVCPPLEALDKVILSRVTELQKLNEAMPTTEEVK